MWCASALASLLLLFGSMLEGSRTEGAAPVLHPGRRVLSAQPEPIHRPAKHPSQCWEVVARVERQLTGKASGWTSEARLLMAATKDAVLERRAELFDEYVHTPQVTLEPKRKTAVVSAPAAQRARRNSAPTTFSLNEGRRGPPPGGGRAGPGRGHTFEHTPHAPVESPLLPPPGVLVANWLTQHTLRKQWETPRSPERRRAGRRPAREGALHWKAARVSQGESGLRHARA
ncbi:hypothetical protein T492DRAFT_1072016 [Pavlovales sp. CCMP2436]|nr:hypothetical protein T492DRAFT_1072016 [Pavlovales sp. CCMP2436]